MRKNINSNFLTYIQETFFEIREILLNWFQVSNTSLIINIIIVFHQTYGPKTKKKTINI